MADGGGDTVADTGQTGSVSPGKRDLSMGAVGKSRAVNETSHSPTRLPGLRASVFF